MGVRSIGLTWNLSNQLAGGSYDADKKIGISKLGKEVVAEMNKLGIIIDASHLNPYSFNEIFELSRDPVIVSHANVYKFSRSKRNLTRKQMNLVARKGGVIGVFFSAKFVNRTKSSIEDVVDNIDYIVQNIGIDFVGIGSDFGGITGDIIKGLENSSQLPNLVRKLADRKYPEECIEKILGKNFKAVIMKILK